MNDEEIRYVIIDGRRWRRSDPGIPEHLRSELVNELMCARRAVRAAKKGGDFSAEHAARDRVQDAKLALGERGREWWLPIDKVSMSKRFAACIRTLLRQRGVSKTICPSDVARVCGGENWRVLMNDVRSAAWQLVDEGWLEITQGCHVVELPVKGPLRLRRREVVAG